MLLAVRLGNSNLRFSTQTECSVTACSACAIKSGSQFGFSPISCVQGESAPGRQEEMSSPEAPCPEEWQTWWPPPDLTLQQWPPPCSHALSLLWQAHRQAAGDDLHPRSAAEELQGLQCPQSCRWKWCRSVGHTQRAPVLAPAGCCGFAWSADSPMQYQKVLTT